MKNYEVEFCRTSYVTITVAAKNEVEAEDLAFEQLKETQNNFDEAFWETNLIEEVE